MSVDERIWELIGQLGKMIDASPTGPRTDEVRDFIREHEAVGDFKELAITMIYVKEHNPRIAVSNGHLLGILTLNAVQEMRMKVPPEERLP